MTRLREQRVILGRVFESIAAEARRLGYDAALDFARRCADCPVGLAKKSAHREARAFDVVLYHRETGEVCREDAIFNALHDLADSVGAAKRIPGDLGHFSVADEGQVR